MPEKKYSQFKHADEITSDTMMTYADNLEAMIAKHKDKIPQDAIDRFYEHFPTLAYTFSGRINELAPVQNRFTDEEIKMFKDTLEKCGFKATKFVDSVQSYDKPQYERHDYIAGNDKALVSILKYSITPVWDRFDKGHADNEYSVLMASPGGRGTPVPYGAKTRCRSMEALCDTLERILIR